jgi:hypothetical protein
MHGRKGPKADPTVCGTTVKFLAENSDFPICIIKDPRVRSIKKDGKYRFGVCYDTSDKSKSALRQVLSMMRPDDHLVCITVKEGSIKLDCVESSVASICAEFNVCHHKIQVLERSTTETVFKCIKNYLIHESNEDNYIDFVAVGNNGVNYMKNKGTTLGSVADMVVRAPKMNVIFCPK